LLLGRVNPSGKLAESYPLCYADVPSAGFYETGGKQAQYREGLYVGYRYYDTAGKDVLFPFGHGLSYTTFDYRDLECSPTPQQAHGAFTVSFIVENTGPVAGAEPKSRRSTSRPRTRQSIVRSRSSKPSTRCSSSRASRAA